jgi:fatty-acyl-CoA synthase
MPDSLADALRQSPTFADGKLIFHLEDGPVHLPGAELAERAQRAARMLRAQGVGRGSVVGILGPNRPEWAVSAWATWLAGAAVLPLQIPLRIRDPSAFAEELRSATEAVGCQMVLADPRLLPVVPGGLGNDWASDKQRAGGALVDVSPDDAAVIQLTSGSTSAPKGAVISHGAVMAQMRALKWWFERDVSDWLLCGWVPFFHDLGLFMNVVNPMVHGVGCHCLPTERFAANPTLWFRVLQSTGATTTHCPPSAFGAALRDVARLDEHFDLRQVEGVWLAAEPVDPHLADQVTVAGVRAGLRATSFGVGYGLAEAVLGVTSTAVGRGLTFDSIDLEAMAANQRALPADGAHIRRVASCGVPAPGIELRIVRSDGDVEERGIGEVYVHSQSLLQRYIGRNVPHPVVDGWLRTGDLGYIADGELYITGRVKDMVIVMGHNYYPEDFEWAAARHPGVRPGRCVAFTDGSGEGIVLIVEPKTDADPVTLPDEVRYAVGDAVGVVPRRVLVVASGTVEKTSSGKLRRSAMREAYARGELQPRALATAGAR